MRTEEEVLNTILSVAQADNRIRAVIINGSRTNKKVIKDDFQDFDIIYLVENLESFKDNPNWIDVFGERIILQMPNSMKICKDDVLSEEEICYLMLFKDLNRIDLNLVKVENKADCKDSLNKVLLDKDNLLSHIVEPNDSDYLVRKPSQKEFMDCCNEFWWVVPYVVKGLAREEVLYAKEMLEIPIRNMFMKMLAWSVGAEHRFTINVGKSNRFLKQYVSESFWNRILNTYPDAKKINIWDSLMEMVNLFDEIARKLADKINLNYNELEAENVKKYLDKMKDTPAPMT